MLYRIAAVMFFALLTVMNLLSAPAPPPSAILDIGPPPKDETVEQYRKRLIEAQTFHGTLCSWWKDPHVRKLPSVARFEDARPWLAKNLRVTPEKGWRRLRFTFRAGSRAEQVAIINALVRYNLAVAEHAIKRQEYWIRDAEKNILELEKRILSTRNPHEAVSYQDGIKEIRTIRIPEHRADIARWKQIRVIKWAR